MAKKETAHRMAEADKAFAHFAWYHIWMENSELRKDQGITRRDILKFGLGAVAAAALSGTNAGAGFKAYEKLGSEIDNLYDTTMSLIEEYQKELSKGLDLLRDQEYKSRLFNAGKQLGEALANYKKEHGFPYPGIVSPDSFKRLEEQALRATLSDTEKQTLFEEYLALWKESDEMASKAEPAMRGLYCGEFPSLCPPIN